MTKNPSLALVTGASSGIGKETALALVAGGFDVAGASRVAAENLFEQGPKLSAAALWKQNPVRPPF